MRCCNCRYCYVNPWDESDWTCGIFGSNAEDMITEDKNGEYGCRYNSQFLKKKERELDDWWHTEQIKQAERIELRQSLKSVPKGIIKLEGADETDFLDYFMAIK
ncbi:MAG: hypothetical protein IJH65_12000 [Methanobrevibacter sp.]|nr:hypothetical protein [Methanobrevibacter sp.]